MPDYLRSFEWACKTARSIIRGHGAPVLPGPMDDGDLLAIAEEEVECWGPAFDADGEKRSLTCPDCGPVSSGEADSCNYIRCSAGSTGERPWWVGRAVEAKEAKTAERSSELLKDAYWCTRHQTTLAFCKTRTHETPVAMQGTVGGDPPAEVPPASAGADSRCKFCQQPVQQLEDVLWFHPGRNRLRCTDIPEFPPTYASPEK